MNFEKTRHLSADIMKLLKQIYSAQQVSTLEKDLLKDKLRALYDAIDESEPSSISESDNHAFSNPNGYEQNSIPAEFYTENEQQDLPQDNPIEESTLEPIAISLEDPMPWDHEKNVNPIEEDLLADFEEEEEEEEEIAMQQDTPQEPERPWQMYQHEEIIISTPTVAESHHVDEKTEVATSEEKSAMMIQEIHTSIEVNAPTTDAIDDIDKQEVEELFYIQEAKELSDKLSLSPISDLTKALGINDRLLTANDLFGGDYTFFDESFKKLNSLHTFEEAKQYLIDHVVKDKDWLNPQKKEKAKRFIKFVKRRYIHVS
jgi:hypothetical protein